MVARGWGGAAAMPSTSQRHRATHGGRPSRPTHPLLTALAPTDINPSPTQYSYPVGARADDVGLGGPSWSPVGGVGPLLCHRQATISRRTTAGDHEGPPIHSTPPSPLRTLMGFYG